MQIKSIHSKNIKLTDHFIERAKQRLTLNIDKNSLEYQVKLKEIITKAEIRDINNNDIMYELIYDNKKFNILATLTNQVIVVKTIICKDGK